MPSGRSLHIGLNRVNPNAYEGWNGQLAGCENDARAMQSIARAQKLAPKTLLTRAATSSAVTAAIADAAATLLPGDLFFLSYSGHGGQVPDRNGDETEDAKDETWVLYDRQLIDDELYALWGRFQTGVRIFVLSDSCHSGTASASSCVSPSIVTAARDRRTNSPRQMLRRMAKSHGFISGPRNVSKWRSARR